MREDDISFERAILTTNLKLFRLNLNNSQIRIFLSYQFNSFCQLFHWRHSSWGKNGQLGRIVGKDIEKFSGCNWVSCFTKSCRFINKKNNILSVNLTYSNWSFSVESFMFHDIFFLCCIFLLIKHGKGTVKIRDQQINNFLVFATPTVNYSWIVVIIIFDGLFHSCKGKLLLFVVAVSTDLNSHWTDQTRIQNLKIFVLVVN